MKHSKQFLTGAEVVVQAARDAGAEMMFGYPITPTCEILSGWIDNAQTDKKLQYLQTEDEIAAGFTLCGAVIAGKKAFTASAGPGHILLQDAFSMAEGMRLPVVLIVGQRGGPSSGTVIYSQQEVNLAIHGGNGEGMRVVYSPSTLEELYLLTRQAFNTAWQYRFPTIVLTDGFLLKTKQTVDLNFSNLKNIKTMPLVSEKTQKNIRNIYTFEEELEQTLFEHKKDFDKMATEVIKSESYPDSESGSRLTVGIKLKVNDLIIAHGIVAGAVKNAVDELQKQGKKVGLFRPITLSPFPKKELNILAKKVKRIIVVESSMGQLRDLVKQNLEVDVKMDCLLRPAVGIETDEVIEMFSSPNRGG